MKPRIIAVIPLIALLLCGCGEPPLEDAMQRYTYPDGPKRGPTDTREKEDPSNLLTEQQDLNLGNSAQVLPFLGTGAGVGETIRLLDVRSPNQRAAVATITMTASIADRAAFATAEAVLVGIIEFGNAGGFNRMEFNIPVHISSGQNGVIDPAVTPVNSNTNGVAISVPGSTFRVFVRNESRAPSPLNGAPITVVLPPVFATPQATATISFLPVGTNSPIKRTFILTSTTATLAPAAAVTVAVPPYAKRVRFPRLDLATTSVDVTFSSSSGTIGTFSVGGADEGDIEISPLYNFMTVTNSGAGAITRLLAEFDIGF